MSDTPFNFLFICAPNDVRSIMAESLTNALSHGRFKAYSAGSLPGDKVHPKAFAALRSVHMPTQGLHCKSWDEFAQRGAPAMDFVITVCDPAHGEVCPIWSALPMTARWAVPDPSASMDTEEVMERRFKDALLTLKRRIELALALPQASLQQMSLQKEPQHASMA